MVPLKLLGYISSLRLRFFNLVSSYHLLLYFTSYLKSGYIYKYVYKLFLIINNIFNIYKYIWIFFLPRERSVLQLALTTLYQEVLLLN